MMARRDTLVLADVTGSGGRYGARRPGRAFDLVSRGFGGAGEDASPSAGTGSEPGEGADGGRSRPDTAADAGGAP